ncbi:MAG: DUF1016 domain-containing protein [Bifidobacteriaceae bacterium]|nr:DUF1016 domain-containing protein [Bifidobacteriaceae bacterium]
MKVGKFRPEFLGKLSAYVGLVDAEVRDPAKHVPTIGILLCTSKNEAVVRFTLANASSALGVADYEGLPAVEELRSAVTPGRATVSKEPGPARTAG